MVARAASRGTKPPPSGIYGDTGAGDLSPAQRTAWYNVIGLFQAKAKEFEQAQAALQSMRLPAGALENERRALLSRASGVRSTVLRIRAALDEVQAALRGAWGLVTGAWDTARSVVGLNGMLPGEPLGALGIAPLIPIALVAAAVATVTAFLTSYGKFVKKVELLQQGYTPEQIAATDPARFGGGMFAGVAGVVVLIAGALLAPPLLRALRSSRGRE